MRQFVCYLFPLVMVVTPQLLFAQPDTLWSRTYGGVDVDYASSVAQASDDGYLVLGTTNSYGAGKEDVWLIRTDSDGETLWARTYGGTRSDNAYSVSRTSDGGYIVVGTTNSWDPSGYDIWLIRTDSQGDAFWARTYGGSDYDIGRSVLQTSDSGFIVAGYAYTKSTGYDIYLVRTNANGDTLWTRTLGGPEADYAYSLAEAPYGSFIVLGNTVSFGAGAKDVWLIKVDSNGNPLWVRTYGGSKDDVGRSVVQTSGGGFIVAGYTLSYGAGSSDVWLIRIDSNGDTLWTRTYGGSDNDEGHSVVETADGGYIIAGETKRFLTQVDVYLIGVDSVGDTLWTRAYGGAQGDEGHSIIETSDGGYIVAGETFSFGAGSGDVYLLKLGSKVGVDENSQISVSKAWRNRVWPNPTAGTCWISYGSRTSGVVKIALYDLTGRVIEEVYEGYQGSGEHRIKVDAHSLPSGIYFLRLETSDGTSSLRMATMR
jgi:regulation of enolase protein 1 (concanavalin A-like superfamily)